MFASEGIKVKNEKFGNWVSSLLGLLHFFTSYF